MLWIYLQTILPSKRLKKEKLTLSKEDLEYFNQYKSMLKGKFHVKKPDNMTEWQDHLWILATQELTIEAHKRMLSILGCIMIGCIIMAIIISIAYE